MWQGQHVLQQAPAQTWSLVPLNVQGDVGDKSRPSDAPTPLSRAFTQYASEVLACIMSTHLAPVGSGFPLNEALGLTPFLYS